MKRAAIDMSKLACLRAAIDLAAFVNAVGDVSPETQCKLVCGRFDEIARARALWGIALVDDAIVRVLRQARGVGGRAR